MGGDGGDAESAGGLAHSSEEPERLLAEAGMVLRDPSTLHLLLTAALWQVSRALEFYLVFTSDTQGKQGYLRSLRQCQLNKCI
jgi:hypothetical protein